MLSPEAKDWLHTGVEVATALGVWGWIASGYRKGKRVGKAVAAAPDMLHGHAEKKGETLTADGISYPFRETAG